MKRKISSFVRGLQRDESGVVAVLVAILIIAIVGLGALAIDVGNLAYSQRRLQETTDMAALAGAFALSCSQVPPCTSGSEITAAKSYSAMSAYNGKNVQAGLNVTSMTAQGKCLTNFGSNNNVYYNASTGQCTALDGYNAIEVQQQATVPFQLGQIFGFGSVTLTATSLAGAKGSTGTPPLNVMIVLDTTQSMGDADSSGNAATCGTNNPTRIQCALFGVRVLLNELAPTQDQVGLMVFPQVSTGTVSDDYSCTANPQPTIEPYSATTGATYQIISASDNYRTSDSAGTLNGASELSNASQYGPNGSACAGVKAVGGEGTYYAGAINAAQSALVASNGTGVCATQKCKNVIILLSDGGAGNASTLWSSTTSQATSAGGTTLTLAAAVPAYVIPGTSVADNTAPCPQNTSNCAISAGTQVVSTSGNTVTLSSAVVSPVTPSPTTNAATSPGNSTLHFAAVPSTVTVGMAVTDTTHPTAIAACTTVTSKTSTTVTLSSAVVGTTAATAVTSAATTVGQTTLFFGSVPGTVTTGMGVTDTTTSSAIPSGSTVVSFTSTSVTISNATGVTTTATTSATTTSSATLHFNSVPSAVQVGMTVTGSGVPSGATVVSTTGTTVVMSKTAASVARNVSITFAGDSVAKGDTIDFTSDVASGDTIAFGGVGCGDSIAFGTSNQCHEAITAAQNAATAGTWVYSVAYGSSTALSPNSNSCSDTETPPISSCTTMQDIASDASKFYSDGSGGSGSCVSQNNAADLGSIFQQIGNSLQYAAILPLGTN